MKDSYVVRVSEKKLSLRGVFSLLSLARATEAPLALLTEIYGAKGVIQLIALRLQRTSASLDEQSWKTGPSWSVRAFCTFCH